jgi:hypothetical protein
VDVTASCNCPPTRLRKPRRHLVRVVYDRDTGDVMPSGEKGTTETTFLTVRANVVPPGMGTETNYENRREGVAKYDVYFDFTPTAAEIKSYHRLIVVTMGSLVLHVDGPPVRVDGETRELRLSAYQRGDA